MANVFVSKATGDNADDGLTEGLAKLTITAAITAASTGDNIVVKADGTYTETIDPDGKDINIIGYTGTFDLSDPASMAAQVVIDGENTRASGYKPTGGTYGDLINLKFINHTSHGVDLSSEGGFDNAIRCENVASNDNGGSGFYVEGNGNVFQNCEANGNTSHGFHMFANYGVTCSYCVANDNTGWGFYNGTSNRSYSMNHCISHNNTGGGVYRVHSVTNCVIDDNGTAIDNFNTGASAFLYKNTQITNNAEIFQSSSGNDFSAENCNFHGNTLSSGHDLSDLSNYSDYNNMAEDPDYEDDANDDFTVNNADMKQNTVRIGAGGSQTGIACIGVSCSAISGDSDDKEFSDYSLIDSLV